MSSVEEFNRQNYRISTVSFSQGTSVNIALVDYMVELGFVFDQMIMFDCNSEQISNNNVNGKTGEEQLQSILQNNDTIKIQINTVLTKKNYQEIEKLASLMQLLIFDEWEVSQFLPHGEGKKNIQKFLITDYEFEKVSTYLEASPIGEKIRLIPISKTINNEWSITPDLQLIRLKEDKPCFFGEIKSIDPKTLERLFESEKTLIK